MNSKNAGIHKHTHRQIEPMQPRLNVKPLAEQVSELMFNHVTDECLNWNSDGSVKVLVGKISPDESAAKQTVAGRRK